MEQPGRSRRSEEVQHEAAAGGLTERGDAARIAAKCRDVVACPFERGDPVLQSEVRAVAAEAPRVQEAERADAIVRADDDHVLLGRQSGTVVDGLRRRAEHERAAVEPHHHRLRIETGVTEP